MTRNSSFETLRLVSIFLIITMHICALMDWENASDINRLIVFFINAIGNIGVTCFVLISGYFGIKFSSRKFVVLIATTTLYCTLIAALRFGVFSAQTVNALIVVPSYNLWFIACYLILMVLAPYINNFAEQLESKEYRHLIICLFILLCVLPTLSVKGATNDIVLRQGGKCLVYILWIYILGRYIRLHLHVKIKRSLLGGAFISSTLVIVLLNCVLSYFLQKKYMIFSFDCSPFILISSLSVFLLFKSWSFQNKIVNWMSASVFGFYLLGDIYLLLDDRYFHLRHYSADNLFIFYLLALLLISWLFSLFIDKTLGIILRRTVDKCYDLCSSKNHNINRIKK